jgi:hypothetical protein
MSSPVSGRGQGEGNLCGRSRPLMVTVVAVAAALLACSPETPSEPSYATDVRPIFLAHCTRCHGAGGTLQGEDGGTNPGPPRVCHLDVYDDEPIGCGVADGGTPPSCTVGAQSCVLLPWYRLKLPTMPPLPATLNDWERDVLNRWGESENPLP